VIRGFFWVLVANYFDIFPGVPNARICMNSSESKHVRAAVSGEGNGGRLLSAVKPEWLRVPEAGRVFGIGRSALYELIAAGKIESTALRKRGAARGIRLIRYASLAAYVERAVREGGIAE
jgi:hypothetical protein